MASSYGMDLNIGLKSLGIVWILLVYGTTGIMGQGDDDCTSPRPNNDCGYQGIGEADCMNNGLGCCFDGSGNAQPNYCYYKKNSPCMKISINNRTACRTGDNLGRSDCIRAGCCYRDEDGGSCFSTKCSAIPVDMRRDCAANADEQAECPNKCCFDKSILISKWCFHQDDSITDPTCDVTNKQRCGNDGITPDDCWLQGCCYTGQEDPNSSEPECYRKASTQDVTCSIDDQYNRVPCTMPSSNGPININDATTCSSQNCCFDPFPRSQPPCYQPQTSSKPLGCDFVAKFTQCQPDSAGEDDCLAAGCCYDTVRTTTKCAYKEPEYLPKQCASLINPTNCRGFLDGDLNLSKEECEQNACCYHISGNCYEPQLLATSGTCDVFQRQPCMNLPDKSTCEDVLHCCFDDQTNECFYAQPQGLTTTPPTTESSSTTTATSTTTAAEGSSTPSEVNNPGLSIYNDDTGYREGLRCTPPPGYSVNIIMEWFVDDVSVYTDVMTPPILSMDRPFSEFDLSSNPEVRCCFQPEVSNGDPYCSDVWRPVQFTFDGGPMTLPENAHMELPYRISGYPSLVCPNIPESTSAEVRITPVGGPLRACANGGKTVFQAPLVHGDQGLCTWSSSGTFVDGGTQQNTAVVAGLVDNRVEGDMVAEFDVDITFKSAGQVVCNADPGDFEVTVEDATVANSDCSVTGGFTVRSFTGQTYSTDLVGVFNMYEHGNLPLAIHIRQKAVQLPDTGNYQSQTCAAAIKSGDDVITFDRCGSDDDEELGPLLMYATINSPLTPATTISQDINGLMHKVILPHGGVATVYSGEIQGMPFLDVFYSPTASDFEPTYGLCGQLFPFTSVAISILADDAADAEANQWRVSEAFAITNEPNEYQVDNLIRYQKYDQYCGCIPSPGISCISNPYERCADDGGVPWNDYVAFLDDVNATVWVDEGDPDARAIGTIVWPTLTGIPKEQASDLCQRLARDVYDQCPKLLPDEVLAATDECVKVIGLSGNLASGRRVMRGLKERCLAQCDQDVTLPPITPPEFCLNDCSYQGTCFQGKTCRCNPGFYGPDCSWTSRDSPTIFDIASGDCCNPRERKCNKVVIAGIFDPALTFTCVISYIEISMDGHQTVNEATYPAGQVSVNQLVCPVPRGKSAFITIRDSAGQSSSSVPYLVFDPRCWDCEKEPVKCRRKNHGCYIHGRCVGKGEETGHPKSWRDWDVNKRPDWQRWDFNCSFCDPAKNGDGWTMKRDQRCYDGRPRPGGDDKPPPPRGPGAKLIGLIIASVILGLIIIILLIFCCCKFCPCYGRIDDDCSSYDGSSVDSSSAGIVSPVCNTRFNNTIGVYASRPYCYK